MNPCPGCARLTDVPLCWDCQGTLAGLLRTAAMLAGELPTNIIRLSVASGPYRIGGRSAEIPLPFDDAADEVATLLAETLAAWAAKLVDVPFFLQDGTASEVAAWLAGHVLRLGQLPDAGACLHEIRCIVERCLDVVEPARRRNASDPGDIERGRDVWVTAIEAQRYLGEVHGRTVRATRIRKWASRGRITGIDGYYRVGDILRLLTNP